RKRGLVPPPLPRRADGQLPALPDRHPRAPSRPGRRARGRLHAGLDDAGAHLRALRWPGHAEREQLGPHVRPLRLRGLPPGHHLRAAIARHRRRAAERPVGTSIWVALGWLVGVLVLGYGFSIAVYHRSRLPFPSVPAPSARPAGAAGHGISTARPRYAQWKPPDGPPDRRGSCGTAT